MGPEDNNEESKSVSFALDGAKANKVESSSQVGDVATKSNLSKR